MIVVDIGHSFIKTYHSNFNLYQKFNINRISIFLEFIKQNKREKIWIGSVNESLLKKITILIKKQNIDFNLITHDHFKNLIKVTNKINFLEIGLDILSIIYFVNDTNYLFINNGTALLYIKYSNQLDGVIISQNIFYNTQIFLNKTKLNLDYCDYDDFGTNTSDAISASITFSFKKTLLSLINKYNFKKIYLNDINPIYMQNIDNIELKYLNNTTLNGYIKLVNSLN